MKVQKRIDEFSKIIVVHAIPSTHFLDMHFHRKISVSVNLMHPSESGENQVVRCLRALNLWESLPDWGHFISFIIRYSELQQVLINIWLSLPVAPPRHKPLHPFTKLKVENLPEGKMCWTIQTDPSRWIEYNSKWWTLIEPNPINAKQPCCRVCGGWLRIWNCMESFLNLTSHDSEARW